VLIRGRQLFLLPFSRRQPHRDLLDNLNVKSFQRGHTPGMIGKQTDALQIQVR
jgi:hypothetical protein